MKICGLIPAAGRGKRLGADVKILTPLTASDTIWSILYAKLAPLVDHIHLVLSPEGAAVFPPLPANVSSSIQPAPIGMGDAIFRALDVRSRYDAVLVVWGDQVFVSTDTLRRTIAALDTPDHHAVLPVTRIDDKPVMQPQAPRHPQRPRNCRRAPGRGAKHCPGLRQPSPR